MSSSPACCQYFLSIVALFFMGQLFAADIGNAEAVIPPQCYTKTEGRYNPCYVCHQTHEAGTRRNGMMDGGLQLAYAFSETGQTNYWQNLFEPPTSVDWSANRVEKWLAENNYSALYAPSKDGYSSAKGTVAYTPDLQFYGDYNQSFDAKGLALDGSGWVAFNYKPFPSTFWPTNGSFDDVLIRLPKAFRESPAHYYINLSLLEMAIKGLEQLSIPLTDEALIDVDLNSDGELGLVDVLSSRSHYIGEASTIPVLPLQYPVGTEFFHAVRYLATDENGQLQPSIRMKELRYSRKYKRVSDQALQFAYYQEQREKALEKLPTFAFARPVGKAGLNNKAGWQVQAWIEAADGSLRPQTYEENFYCMGCHTSVGTTIDSTFAFPRKVTGADGWGYIDLRAMADVPNRAEPATNGYVIGEIETYMRRVGGGDEFRQNQEMRQRWFNADGSLNAAAVRAADVYELITPSAERALALNRAYIGLVQAQAFTRGRDAVTAPATNVYEHVDQEKALVLPAEHVYRYDLRLDWTNTPH